MYLILWQLGLIAPYGVSSVILGLGPAHAEGCYCQSVRTRLRRQKSPKIVSEDGRARSHRRDCKAKVRRYSPIFSKTVVVARRRVRGRTTPCHQLLCQGARFVDRIGSKDAASAQLRPCALLPYSYCG